MRSLWPVVPRFVSQHATFVGSNEGIGGGISNDTVLTLSCYQREATQRARATSAVAYGHDRELDHRAYTMQGPIILSK